MITANDGKHLNSMIIALDGLLANRCQRDTIPDMFGDNRIDQYLPVVSQTAKP